MIPKQGIRNDPIDHIWVWDFFFAYSLFFNKRWKDSISWDCTFLPSFEKSRFAWNNHWLQQNISSCHTVSRIILRKILCTGCIVLLIFRLPFEIMNESPFSFGFGTWLHSVARPGCPHMFWSSFCQQTSYRDFKTMSIELYQLEPQYSSSE